MEESCSIHELYEGIQSGCLDVPGSNSQVFIFPTYLPDCLFSCVIGKKQKGPFQACTVHADLKEVTMFRNYISYLVEKPSSVSTSKQCVHNVDKVLMEVQVSFA